MTPEKPIQVFIHFSFSLLMTCAFFVNGITYFSLKKGRIVGSYDYKVGEDDRFGFYPSINGVLMAQKVSLD
ncbi:MAG: hypothetical protein R2883_04400 [Caldisericia bacterium]